jgi:hypothetical protein
MAKLVKSVIVCDTENCGWEKEIPSKECRKWIGRKCPKCGAVLLTRRAYFSNRLFYLALCLSDSVVYFFLKHFKNKKFRKGIIRVHSMNNGKITDISEAVNG